MKFNLTKKIGFFNLIAILGIASSPLAVFAETAAPLGLTYTMVEDSGNWSGECTNLGSDTYRCQMEKFTSGDRAVYTARVSLSGNRVLIRRGTSSTDFNSCLYTGNLNDSGYVSGTYKCKNAGNTAIPWEAFLKN